VAPITFFVSPSFALDSLDPLRRLGPSSNLHGGDSSIRNLGFGLRLLFAARDSRLSALSVSSICFSFRSRSISSTRLNMRHRVSRVFGALESESVSLGTFLIFDFESARRLPNSFDSRFFSPCEEAYAREREGGRSFPDRVSRFRSWRKGEDSSAQDSRTQDSGVSRKESHDCRIASSVQCYVSQVRLRNSR
jgi:hypothetical protein